MLSNNYNYVSSGSVEAWSACMSFCSYTTTAEVDLEALAYNYNQLRRLASPSVKFLAVVKADGYGHGAVPVAKKLEELSADFLGVARLQEGIELRNGGIKKPILVLSGVYQEEVEEVLAYQLTPLVYRWEIAEALSAAAGKRGKKIPLHIKVDTGMGRIGVLAEEAPAFADRVRKLENLEIEGIASHLSTADEGDSAFAEDKREGFSRIIEEMKKLDIDPPFRHIENSAPLVNLPAAHFTVVRPGIMLYGSYPP